ncbi:TonB-dependent siderophore receptor [Pseudoalteromonas spongiae]|uniref:TonB-dependent siderophore receptor n=1 Tax=Pseudoalteromonas spongiae TaxID=298657 RepID=UPI00026C9F37|nr:TonB-dependent siderophore receptor [Pseudoalteromonas spongiae]ATC97450.1 iron complex outermembrane recepter protein [Pseudoalteromonas spongiae UST010723-006]
MKFSRLALAVSAILMLPHIVFANEPSDTSQKTKKDLKDIEVIEILGRSSQSTFSDYSYSVTRTAADILEIPQSISAVTKEVIQDQAMMRLNDVTPFVSGANEYSVYDDITIRGFRSQDDRRVNGMRTHNNFWNQTLIAHVERVEVIKGPASAVFGDASPGGTVNTVTKKPLAESRHSISARVGSYSDKYIALDSTGQIAHSDDLLYRFNGGYEDSDTFRDNIFNKSLLLSPSLTYLLGQDTKLNFEVVYSDSKGLLDRGQPNLRGATDFSKIPMSLSSNQPGDKLDTTSLSASLTLDHHFNDYWSLGFKYMHLDSEQKLVEHRAATYIADSDSVFNVWYTDRDIDADSDNVTAYVTGKLYTGDIEHNIVVGGDYIDNHKVNSQRMSRSAGTFDILNPTYQQPNVDSYNLGDVFEFGGGLTSNGLYIQDHIKFEDLSILASLRREDYKLTDLNGNESSDSDILPRLGVVYNLSLDSSVYASWVTGFEPPSTFLNTEEQGGPFGPIDSYLYEVGYKTKLFDEKVLLTTSLYQITKQNVLVQDLERSTELGYRVYRQRGEEQAKGFEFDINGQITEDWLVIANYAYNRAEITEDSDPTLIGKQKENAPKNSATLWSKYTLTDTWQIAGGATFIDERNTSDDAVLPSYTILQAGVYFTQPKWQAALLIDNLLDKDHWTGGYSYGQLFPGDPRTVSLTMNYTW